MFHSAGIRMRNGLLEESDPPIKARRLLEMWILERERGEIRSDIHPVAAAIGMIGALQSRSKAYYFGRHLDVQMH